MSRSKTFFGTMCRFTSTEFEGIDITPYLSSSASSVYRLVTGLKHKDGPFPVIRIHAAAKKRGVNSKLEEAARYLSSENSTECRVAVQAISLPYAVISV